MKLMKTLAGQVRVFFMQTSQCSAAYLYFCGECITTQSK
jgi:hypothetical protein